MSSLYKRANDYWYVAFYDGSKRPTRKHVSTGTKVKRDAAKVQKRFDRAILLNEYDPWTDDSDTFEPKQLHRDDSPDLALLGSSVAAFLASRSNLSPYTQERYRSVLERLRDSLGAEREVAGLSTPDILRFLDGTDTKPVTQHSYRRAMRTYFRWLEERDAIAGDPTADLRLERAPDKHPRFLEPSDVDAICRAIVNNEQRPKVTPGTSGWLLPIVRANVYLGLRAGEVVNLRWADVDLDAKRLTVANTDTFTTKAGKERTVPLAAPALDVLRKMERRSDWVFANHGGTQLHRLYLSRRFKHFAKMAELPDAINFHATRHTAASWLAQQGASVEAIRRFMGHSSIQVTQKYMHLSPDGFAGQIERAFDAVA